MAKVTATACLETEYVIPENELAAKREEVESLLSQAQTCLNKIIEGDVPDDQILPTVAQKAWAAKASPSTLNYFNSPEFLGAYPHPITAAFIPPITLSPRRSQLL